jgi:hypothetical protein
MERGQASVEWIGLLLAIALAMGALALGARGAAREGGAGRELGVAVAERITCGARVLGPGADGGPAPAGARRCGPAAGGSLAARRRGRPGVPAVPPFARRALPRLRRDPDRPRSGARARVERAGRRAAQMAEGAWLACLGIEALRYDLQHPRAPHEMRPIEATLDIVGNCVSPWEGLFG